MLDGCGLTAIHASAGSSVLALYPGLDNIGGTSNTWIDSDSLYRAIGGTGSTFHTSVPVNNSGFMGLNFKDTMGADDFTSSAASADLCIELQGGHTPKISKFLHGILLNKRRSDPA